MAGHPPSASRTVERAPRALPVRALAAAALLAAWLGACGGAGGARPAAGGEDAPAATAAAVEIRGDRVFARYPPLAAAVDGANRRQRQAFGAALARARARGEDVSDWRLRLAWRGLMGNRYLRVAEGEGEALQGKGGARPIVERFTYDGISGRVLALEDWFDDEAVWQALAAAVRDALAAAGGGPGLGEGRGPAIGTGTLREARYAPVFSADGPVMGFDLLFAPGQVAPETAGVRRVRIPREAVEPYLAAAHRASLDAMAASH